MLKPGSLLTQYWEISQRYGYHQLIVQPPCQELEQLNFVYSIEFMAKQPQNVFIAQFNM